MKHDIPLWPGQPRRIFSSRTCALLAFFGRLVAMAAISIFIAYVLDGWLCS